MHDKNGKPVQTGDRVTIEAVIGETYAAEDYCNVQLWIGRDRENGPDNVHGTVTINSRQVELIDERDVLSALKDGESIETILQYFAYGHLPAHLQAVSKPFGEMALMIFETLPRNPERTVALRKLLESKDAAVRAKLAK